MVENRLEKVRAKLFEKNWDALIISKPLDIFYSASFNKFFNIVEFNPIMIITLKKQYIIADPATIYNIKKITQDNFEYIVCYIKDYLINRGIYYKEIKKILNNENCKIVAVDDDFIKNKFKNKFSVVSSERIISYLAISKDQEQKKNLISASEILKKTFNESLNFINDNITELELRNFIDISLHKNGSERLGVPTLIAFGRDSVFSDPVPTLRKIKEGQQVMLEFSSGVGTEAPIVGRSFIYKNKDKQYLSILEKILNAYNKMISWIEYGKLSSKAFDILYTSLGDLGKFITHSGGYGLGASSDYFYISPISNHLFQMNETLVTVVSVAIPEVGYFRYSDTILISETKEILTKIDYPLIFPDNE